MKFNLETQDLLTTEKINTTPKEQDLGLEEELSDEEATTIGGGRRSSATSSTGSNNWPADHWYLLGG